MAFAIGLRFYRIHVRRKSDKRIMAIGPGAVPCDLQAFIEAFVDRRRSPTELRAEQRTWFFQPRDSNYERTSHGYINYGTHGFESIFKDVKTRKERYKRQSTDLEEIPLYFQFWSPEDENYGLAVFQSFQGRSCVTHIRSALSQEFEQSYPGFQLLFSVFMPAADFVEDAPVKSVTFLKPRRAKDRADRPVLGRPIDEIEYQLTVKARKRGGIISTYKDIRDQFGDQEGFVTFEGQEYEAVKADVNMGKRRRTIGVFGNGYEAGLIDVTSEVESAANGHPTFKSMVDVVEKMLGEFYGGVG